MEQEQCVWGVPSVLGNQEKGELRLDTPAGSKP